MVHLGDAAVCCDVADGVLVFFVVDPSGRYGGLPEALLVALAEEAHAAMMPSATLH